MRCYLVAICVLLQQVCCCFSLKLYILLCIGRMKFTLRKITRGIIEWYLYPRVRFNVPTKHERTHCIKQGLGRALDPLANGVSLSKLTK